MRFAEKSSRPHLRPSTGEAVACRRPVECGGVKMLHDTNQPNRLRGSGSKPRMRACVLAAAGETWKSCSRSSYRAQVAVLSIAHYCVLHTAQTAIYAAQSDHLLDSFGFTEIQSLYQRRGASNGWESMTTTNSSDGGQGHLPAWFWSVPDLASSRLLQRTFRSAMLRGLSLL
jgi:hypothetical protein